MAARQRQARPVVVVPSQPARKLAHGLESTPVQALNRAYVAALRGAGLSPVLLPTRCPLPDDLSFAQGLVLPGGPDVDPLRYGMDLDPSTEPEPECDELEFALLDWALREGVPILGICRGLQVFNVALGGTLTQDLPQHSPKEEGSGPPQRDRLDHALTIQPGSLLASLIGEEDLLVNSLHHQGVERLAPSLRASAWAPDGLVEAAELEGERFCLAVQYHPEELVGEDPRARQLFAAFAERCQRAQVGSGRAEPLPEAVAAP